MTKKNPSRIKVVSVVTRVAMDSAGKQAILITDSLDTELYETILVTGCCESNEVDMSHWVNDYEIQHVHIPEMKREIRLFVDFVAFLKMFWLFIRERPQIVHTRTAKAGTIGRIAAKLAGVPVIIHTFDGHVFNGYFGKYKTIVILGIERMLARFTDRIIAISNSQKQELLEYLKISDPDKIQVIHIGFDFKAFKPAANGSLRKELHISDDDLLVGFVGRLAPIKRLDRLFAAYGLVARKVPTSRFIIAGDGEHRELAERLAEEHGIKDRTYFLGVRQDLERIYSCIDVLAMSSDNEGTPAVLIEALYYGKPVVSTRVGGVPDVVVDGVNGLLSKANGPEDLADSLVHLLENKDLRNRMGLQGEDEVKRKFSIEALIEKLDKLYVNELMEKSSRYRERVAEMQHSR